MKVTILADNTALLGRMYVAEHGFPAYIGAEGKRVLSGTGSSGAFPQNAGKREIGLPGHDCLVLSHGHADHTGGLRHLLRRFTEAATGETTHRFTGVPTGTGGQIPRRQYHRG